MQQGRTYKQANQAFHAGKTARDSGHKNTRAPKRGVPTRGIARTQSGRGWRIRERYASVQCVSMQVALLTPLQDQRSPLPSTKQSGSISGCLTLSLCLPMEDTYFPNIRQKEPHAVLQVLPRRGHATFLQRQGVVERIPDCSSNVAPKRNNVAGKNSNSVATVLTVLGLRIPACFFLW